MWKEFVEAFGWRFNGVEGYQAAQMWVSEMETWVNYQEAQQSVHLTALRRGLALSILFNVILLAVLLVSIGGR